MLQDICYNFNRWIMKNTRKKLFINKIQMVVYTIIFIVCIALFILIGKMDFKTDSESEAKKFSNIYPMVSDNNVYVFATATDVLNILNGRSGVVLLGFPSNKWTSYYAKILNDVAMELGIEKISYYDFLSDRDESNGTYETVVKTLNVYAPVDDEGNQNLQAPTVIVVKDGNVLGYFDETSIIKGLASPEVYYNDYQISTTHDNFKRVLEEYLNNKGE